jgi:hypothetical protein
VNDGTGSERVRRGRVMPDDRVDDLGIEVGCMNPAAIIRKIRSYRTICDYGRVRTSYSPSEKGI